MEFRKNQIEKGYPSPRWSGEILDCSMPMTFDQYNRCSYNCLYCFSYFQKALKKFNPLFKEEKSYQKETLKCVNVKRVKEIFTLKRKSQFAPYIKAKYVMQWGGLGDPFDEYEREHGVGLELLEFFKEINYPICFSTKGTWWTKDDRYVKLFKGQKNWNVKFSIINYDSKLASKIECGCPSVEERLSAIKTVARFGAGGVTLRLRPFIIGMSDLHSGYMDLIERCADLGAGALSTEFFCLEGRAHTELKKRYDKMSKALGFDILDFYRRNSKGAGYLRLNWKIKKQYIDRMEQICKRVGMRFYVSDAHHKDKCFNGSCCGLGEEWNYCRGQFTSVLVKARKRSDGRVYWSKDMEPYVKMFKSFLWRKADNFNTQGARVRAGRWKQTMYDYIHEVWNSPNSLKSPYKYFGGLLKPVGVDYNKDVIYKYEKYE